MTRSSHDIVARLATAGEDLPASSIDIAKVMARAGERRKRRATVLVATSAAIVLFAVGGLYVHGRPAPRETLAARSAGASSNLPVVMAPGGCPAPVLQISPSGKMNVASVSADQPLRFQISEKDTPKAKLLTGALVLSKPGTGYDSDNPLTAGGQPNFAVASNQIARWDVVPLSGSSDGTLIVTDLGPGVYPLSFIGTYVGGADCADTLTHQMVFIVGQVTIG